MHHAANLTAAFLLLAAVSCAPAGGPAAGKADAEGRAASFADFDRRAKAGERLNVAFFGASLTWGANASDPQLTSFRAQVADLLRERYPQAHFRFWDGAIGGTGSQLGVFRLQRDALSRRPDLVFLDFSANDDIFTARAETLASYESLVRRIVQDGRAPVVIVIFPFLWNVTQGNTNGMAGREAHLTIAAAYNAPVGDAIVLSQQRVKEGRITPDEMYPIDGVHPGDEGYGLFAEAAWEAFLRGVRLGVTCTAPAKMLHAATYMAHARVRISSLGKLPDGWRVGRAYRVSAWYDALMSRWLDDVAIASNRVETAGPDGKKTRTLRQPAPLVVKFDGSMVMLFGERSMKSGKFRVYVDGQAVKHKARGSKEPVEEFDASATMFGGNTHLTEVIAEGLDPAVEHTLEIRPELAADAEQELRIESICVAGGKARVVPAGGERK